MKKALTLLLTVTPTMTALAKNTGAAPSPFAGNILPAIVAVGVFVVVMIVLKLKAWGPILEGLQAREGKIKGDLEAAQAAAQAAEARLKEYEAKLAAAAGEVHAMIEQGKVDTEHLVTRMKSEAATEITNLRARSEKDIAAAREQAIADVYAQAGELAVAVAGKILKRDMSGSDQAGLVSASLAELGKIS